MFVISVSILVMVSVMWIDLNSDFVVSGLDMVGIFF